MYDYRKTLLIVVSREPPAKLFDLKVEKDIAVGFLIENNINFLANNGSTIYSTVGEILSDVAMGHIGYVLPYIGIDQKSVKYLGLAIMKDSKMIGTIDVSESKGLLLLLAENVKLTELIPGFKNKENMNSFRMEVDKRRITTEYIDNTAVINIKVDIKAQLQYQYYLEPISDKDIKQMENILEKE